MPYEPHADPIETFAIQMKNVLRRLARKRRGGTIIVNYMRRPSRDVILEWLTRRSQDAVRLDRAFDPELLIEMLATTHMYHDGAIIITVFNDEWKFSPVIRWVRIWLPFVGRSRVNLVIAGRGTRHVTAFDISEITLADVFVNSEQRGEATLMHQGQVEQNIGDDRIVNRVRESCRMATSEKVSVFAPSEPLDITFRRIGC